MWSSGVVTFKGSPWKGGVFDPFGDVLRFSGYSATTNCAKRGGSTPCRVPAGDTRLVGCHRPTVSVSSYIHLWAMGRGHTWDGPMSIESLEESSPGQKEETGGPRGREGSKRTMKCNVTANGSSRGISSSHRISSRGKAGSSYTMSAPVSAIAKGRMPWLIHCTAYV